MNDKKIRKAARLLILVIAIITIFSFYFISKLTFNYDFESFFPEKSQETAFYKNYRNAFETDNDFFIVGLKNKGSIFDEEFLIKVDQLTEDIKELPYVNTVISITNAKEFVREPMLGSVFEKPLIHIDEPARYKSDSLQLFSTSDYQGTLISSDARSIAIWAKHDQYLSKAKSDTLSFKLNELLDKYSFEETHSMGRSIGQKIYVSMMKQEMVIFMSLSFLLILIFLFLTFRSFWGIWIPVAVVLLAIIWNLAVIYLLGNQIELMLTVLPTILFVVGMSDVIHIISRYLDELRLGVKKKEALKITLREVGLATFLTSVTTSIGFLSLLTSSIQPINRFGIYTAIGVVLAFVLAFSLLPAIFYLRKKPISFHLKKEYIDWRIILHRIFLWILGYKKKILYLFIAFLGLGLFGITKIVSDNFLLEDIGEDHPMRIEMDFFDNEFSGARPVEIALILDSSITELTPQLLKQIDTLDSFIKESYGVGAIMSPAIIIKRANKAYHGGSNAYNKIPNTKKKLSKILKYIKKSGILNNYWNPKNHFARIYGQSRDLGRKHFDGKNILLNEFIRNNLSQAEFKVKVTGTARLMDLNNERLSITMIYGLIIAFGIITIIVGILFKSVSMVLISLIPNILPLILIGGYMGYVGIPLKVTTSIVFTIAFGIAVDDTIHFLSKFRIELSKGKSKLYALKRTYISTGKAIMITSLILCGGFLTLMFSDFKGTYYVGVLISLTLVFAVLADLVLLPVLIILFYRGKN